MRLNEKLPDTIASTSFMFASIGEGIMCKTKLVQCQHKDCDLSF